MAIFGNGLPRGMTYLYHRSRRPKVDIDAAGVLRRVTSPPNMQGIKVTQRVNVAQRDAIWDRVVRQVNDHSCGLGYRADPPPVLDRAAAEPRPPAQPTPCPGRLRAGTPGRRSTSPAPTRRTRTVASFLALMSAF